MVVKEVFFINRKIQEKMDKMVHLYNICSLHYNFDLIPIPNFIFSLSFCVDMTKLTLTW